MNTEMSLYSIVRRKKPGIRPGKPHKVFENKLHQDFHADKPKQKWCTDFTCLFLKNEEVRYNYTIVDLHDRSNLERFRAHMEDFSKRYHLDMFFSCDQYLEFLPEGINKGSGIRFLCDYLQIPLDNTLAAGDAENDITMLETVKLPCVMKNARPEMYPYGKYITEHDNNHSGIAEIIEKFML